jgi:hypothetical protein
MNMEMDWDITHYLVFTIILSLPSHLRFDAPNPAASGLSLCPIPSPSLLHSMINLFFHNSLTMPLDHLVHYGLALVLTLLPLRSAAASTSIGIDLAILPLPFCSKFVDKDRT